MTLHIDQDLGRIVLRAEGEFNIYGAMEFRDALLKALRGEGDLEIDLAAVGEMDGAGLQLLLLARREAGALGKRMLLAGTSPVVREVMQLCNVSAWFETAPAAPGAAAPAAP